MTKTNEKIADGSLVGRILKHPVFWAAAAFVAGYVAKIYGGFDIVEQVRKLF